MNSILRRIAVAIGFVLFLIALGIGLLRDVPLLSALWRAAMIMLLGSLVVSLFFQYFAHVLYDYIAEQRRLQEEVARKEAEKKDKERQERMERVAKG